MSAPEAAGAAAGGAQVAAPVAAAEPGGEEAARAELERLRREIEAIDRQLLELIARRVHLAREVGRAKHAIGLPILDPAREAAVVRRAGEMAREAGLEDEDVRYLFWHLIGLTRRVQMQER